MMVIDSRRLHDFIACTHVDSQLIRLESVELVFSTWLFEIMEDLQVHDRRICLLTLMSSRHTNLKRKVLLVHV